MKLTITNLTKSFGDKKALNEINLELSTGVYGILGANGSGKTTLTRILANVMKPTSGQIDLDGQDISIMDEKYRDLIGYLPQHVGFYKNFSAEKFLKYVAALKGLPKEDTNEKVEEVLELVGLADHHRDKIGGFSGGMKRRIGIAQALLNDPKILIVDEPTVGLDPKERIRFRNLLSKISTNRIVILSTHIVSDIEFIAKEVLILKEGQVVKKETPQTLLKGIEDKVWTLLIDDENEVTKYQADYRVGNIARIDNKFQLRILSDHQPEDDAVHDVPNLEDLYLYYFDEEETA